MDVPREPESKNLRLIADSEKPVKKEDTQRKHRNKLKEINSYLEKPVEPVAKGDAFDYEGGSARSYGSSQSRRRKRWDKK